MRRLAGIIAVFLLLTSITPVLACVIGGPMSNKESACCRSLKGNCAKMEKMGCCRTELRTDEARQIVAASPASESPHLASLSHPADLTATLETDAAASLGVPADHSPPGFLSANITVLRI